MELQTKVEIKPSSWKINPEDNILCVGSCFADNIGSLLKADNLNAEVNPHGVMYNPVSVVRSVEKSLNSKPSTLILTLGTNHVYREKATGEIVDTCRKRPQQLFHEEIMNMDECYEELKKVMASSQQPTAKVILTVSPIRYRKYGYHESQLSKATLLLAVDRLVKEFPQRASYFPAYELMNDELRDYRFYKPDMLHPSQQAVDYIYERFQETYFSERMMDFLEEWRPIKEALGHRPLNAESEEYRVFREQTEERLKTFNKKWKATK